MTLLSTHLDGQFAYLSRVSSYFEISKDNSFAIYTDGHLQQYSNPDPNRNGFSVSLQNGSIYPLNPNPTQIDTDVYSPQIINSLNKVVYLRRYTDNTEKVHIANWDGTQISTIFNANPLQYFIPFNLEPTFMLVGNENYVLFNAIYFPVYSSNVYYAKIDGSGSGIVGAISNISSISKSPNDMTLAFNSGNSTVITQVGQWIQKTLPYKLSNIRFSNDSKYLLGIDASNSNLLHLYDLEKNVDVSMCTLTSSETLLNYSMTNQGKLIAILAESINKSILVKDFSDLNCKQLNSFPLSNIAAIQKAELKVSSDGFNALVKIKSKVSSVGYTQEDLFFVPLNNSATLQVTIPLLNSTTSITDFNFDNTSSGLVLFSGVQIKANEIQLFYWKAPTP